MGVIRYIIYEAEPADSRRIWEIRYHPLVNAMALKQELVDFGRHDEWFKKQYGTGSEHRCYVLKADNKVIGYCRFNLNKEGSYVVSIAVDPNYHGQGAGTFLLSSSLGLLSSGKTVVATIKKANDVSRRLFERAGFVVIREDGGNVTMEKEST